MWGGHALTTEDTEGAEEPIEIPLCASVFSVVKSFCEPVPCRRERRAPHSAITTEGTETPQRLLYVPLSSLWLQEFAEGLLPAECNCAPSDNVADRHDPLHSCSGRFYLAQAALEVAALTVIANQLQGALVTLGRIF